MSRSPLRRAAAPALAVTASLVVTTLPVLAAPAAAVSPDVVLAEVYGGGGNSGATLTHDFVELRNLGSAPVDLTGWAVQYASATGTSWQVTSLSGTIAPDGRYLVQQAKGNGGTTALPTPDATGTTAMSGSAGKVALTRTTAACTGVTCEADALVDLVGYGTTATGFEGRPAPGTTNTTSVARTGGDTDDNSKDFAVGPPTPASSGVTRPEPEPEPSTSPCEVAPTHEIGAVQGTGAATPLDAAVVTVRGVVVGDVPGLAGFYLQDADGDGTAATSDGVFVSSGAPVALGDTVAVTGRASEEFGQTQVSAGDDVQVCAAGSAAALPAAAHLDLPAGDAAREAFEGMLVRPVDALTVSEVFALTRFGELLLSQGGRLVQPTELARPGTAVAAAVAAGNVQRRIVLDDAVSSRTSATSRPYLTPDTPVRVGDVLGFTAPVVLGYGFGAWRLQPADGTAEGTFAPTNTRPADVADVGGDLQVGAFNVLNYFLTFGGLGRGADDAAGLERQAAKIVTAIEEMDADVLTLMEIEDTASTGYGDGSPDQALADLVRRLNEAAGRQKWAYVPFPEELLAVDRDVIRNAIIYQPASVEMAGRPAALVDEVNFDNAREPIAQTFASRGDRFTVIANHFKSKGSGSGANADQGDGQGASNADRVAQAHALAGFVEHMRDVSKDDDVLVLGDLNAYSQEDPIEVLREAGLTDLGERFDEGGYSYVFNGLSGSLDHAMATGSLTAKVTDVAHWNINSVESFAYQYEGDPALYAPHEYRSSDHDPVLVGLALRQGRSPVRQR